MSLKHFFFSEITSAVSQEQKPKAPCRQNSPNRRCVISVLEKKKKNSCSEKE